MTQIAFPRPNGSPAYCDPDNEVRGGKYDRDMDIKDVAKAVRGDIRAAVKEGELPKGKYSVKIERYSMGQSCNVRVMDLPRVLFLNPERVRLFSETEPPPPLYQIPMHTEIGASILQTLKEILDSYNRDNSDTQSDYFDVKFYGDANFDWQLEKAQREWIESIPANIAIRPRL
jgi:hypothetical protein